MLSTDRTEFDAQLEILCAGYDRPVGNRSEAYWKACAKMSLIEFARIVEHAISPDGPTKFPSTHDVWDILKKLRTESRRRTIEQPQDARDHLEFYGNRLLLRHMGDRRGLGSMGKFVPGHGLVDCGASAELLDCRRAMKAVVDWFTEPVRDDADDATPAAFIESAMKAIAAVSIITPATIREWSTQMQDPAAHVPFPAWMARPLPRTNAVPSSLLERA